MRCRLKGLKSFQSLTSPLYIIGKQSDHSVVLGELSSRFTIFEGRSAIPGEIEDHSISVSNTKQKSFAYIAMDHLRLYDGHKDPRQPEYKK